MIGECCFISMYLLAKPLFQIFGHDMISDWQLAPARSPVPVFGWAGQSFSLLWSKELGSNTLTILETFLVQAVATFVAP